MCNRWWKWKWEIYSFKTNFDKGRLKVYKNFYPKGNIERNFKSDSLYLTFKENLFLEDSSWNQININQIQSEFLVKHPYFNWNLDNAIVNFRTQHGPFESKDKIKEIHLVNDKIYRKIAPYLKVN